MDIVMELYGTVLDVGVESRIDIIWKNSVMMNANPYIEFKADTVDVEITKNQYVSCF